MNGKKHRDHGEDPLLSIFGQTGCLSEEVLLQYAQDELDPAAHKAAEMHLLDCALCSDALEGLVLMTPTEFKSTSRVIRERVADIAGVQEKRVVRFRAWRYAAAALVVGALATSWLLVTRYWDGNTGKVATSEQPGQPARPLEHGTLDSADALTDSTRVALGAVPDANTGEEFASTARVEDVSIDDDMAPRSQPLDVSGFTEGSSAGRGSVPTSSSTGYLGHSDTLTVSDITTITATGGTNTYYSWDQPTELNEVAVKRTGGRDAKAGDKHLKAATKESSDVDRAAAEEYKPAQDPVLRQQLVDDGVNYFTAKLYDQAIGNFLQVLDVDPSNETALYYSSACYIQQGQPGLALNNLDKLMTNSNSPYYDMAQWSRAQALLGEGDTKSAKKQLHEIIEKGSSYEGQARQQLLDLE
jgi:hypothetical protein